MSICRCDPISFSAARLLHNGMIRNFLSNTARPLRDAAVARLGTGGLTALAMALGIAAAACVALHFYLPGLALFALNRAAAILAGARNSVAAIPVTDLLIYAALAFGFAIADPARALAASFLLLGIVVLAGCAVVFDAKQGAVANVPLIVGTIIFAAIVLCCIQPERFSLVAYLFGLLCFPLAGTFAASSIVRRP
jgi:hypothetical protein